MTNANGKRQAPFGVKDCTLITRMAGVPSAINLREMRERVSACPLECIYHHFCETQIRPSFDDPEFRNDFAVWASRGLRDRVLAERLGVLNPYAYSEIGHVREALLELLDDRLSEIQYIPWVPHGMDFRFMMAATVIFDTGVELRSLKDLAKSLPVMSKGSIYYHFVEARRRTPGGKDDFTAWLEGLKLPPQSLIEELSRIDFYFLSLEELKMALVEALKKAVEGGKSNA